MNKTEDKKRKIFGEKCESIAAAYLDKRGYEILKRRYRYKRGEIDLIAKKEQLLVFVEVKGRATTNYGMPESFVDTTKENLIIEAADHYIYETSWQGDIRFDIISVVFCENSKEYIIDHFKDAFY